MSRHDAETARLADAHDRLLRSQARIRLAMATQRLDLPFATCVITDDLPDVHDLNLMAVSTAVPAHVLLRSIEHLAQRVGWSHRRIEIDDPGIAAPLRMPLLDAGYTEQRLATMVLSNAPRADAATKPTAVVEVEAQVELTRAATAEQPWATSAATVEQLVERERRLARVADARVVVAPPDQPVSRCLLVSHGGLFEIDAVGTLEAHRRQGWSAAVVRGAIAEAVRSGADDIALVADTADWPSGWYARLGFTEAGHSLAYERSLAA